jgi:hypothetical protein
MSDTSAGGTPAGWYEDGVTAGQERYWDGTQWTDQFRPLPGAVPAEPVAPAAPVVPVVPVAAEVPAVEPVTAAYPEAAPGAYPAYQPAVATPRTPGKGLSTGALIGIIVGAVVVVAAIVVLIIGASTNWFSGGAGGGASSAQTSAFLETARANAETVGASYTDQQLLETGTKLCAAAAKIDPNDPMGSLSVIGELGPLLSDPLLLGIASSGLYDLCPDIADRLSGVTG